MIKAIVFDFGGVVIPGVVLKWIKDLKETDPKYLLFKEKSHQWDLGELSIEEFYYALSEITEQDMQVVQKTHYNSVEMYPEVVSLIKALKKHYKVVLFTNNFAYNVEKYFEKLPLANLFDEVVISSNHKMVKPDPAFYKKMLEIIKLEPKNIVFIDDSQENVDASNRLGIKAFLYTNVDQLKIDLHSIGVTI